MITFLAAERSYHRSNIAYCKQKEHEGIGGNIRPQLPIARFNYHLTGGIHPLSQLISKVLEIIIIKY